MRHASSALPGPVARPTGRVRVSSLVAVGLAVLAMLGTASTPGGPSAAPGTASTRMVALTREAVRVLSGTVRAGQAGHGRTEQPRTPRAVAGISHGVEAPPPPAALPHLRQLPVPRLLLAHLVHVPARLVGDLVPPVLGRGPPADRSTLPT